MRHCSVEIHPSFDGDVDSDLETTTVRPPMHGRDLRWDDASNAISIQFKAGGSQGKRPPNDSTAVQPSGISQPVVPEPHVAPTSLEWDEQEVQQAAAVVSEVVAEHETMDREAQ